MRSQEIASAVRLKKERESIQTMPRVTWRALVPVQPTVRRVGMKVISCMGIYVLSPGVAPRLLIRPKCITILYRNSSLFIDIFHVTMMFLCCFGLFYTVCNFPVPKQQTQDSAVKNGR